MPPDPARRLATVLFLDIVGSTRVAANIGDRRWKAVLGSFRRAVRSDLKRYRGHEEDTTGDGFFATFSQPADAIAAAVAIVRDVQAIGVDVRCGLHFGECEVIEGRLGGIAVHIGARVMSLAGPAEVVITTTIRDLIVGSELDVADAGVHELKGVPGTWQVWRIETLHGKTLPAPLADEAAGSRLAGHQAATRRSRRRILVAGGAVVLATVVALSAMTVNDGWLSKKAAALVGLGPDPARASLVRIDPATNAIVAEVRDQYHAVHLPSALWSVNGALWQGVNEGFSGLVRRDIGSGAVVGMIPLENEPAAGAFGFGSIWLAGLTAPGSIERWDQVSGRQTASLSVDATVVSIAAGSDAIWALGDSGALFRVDPVVARVEKRLESGATMPGVVVPLADRIWVCDCEAHRLIEFDPGAGRVVRALSFPQTGFLVGLTDEAGSTTLWLIDLDGNTVTPIDAASGQAGQPIGVGENLHTAAVAFDSLWIARGDKLLRVPGPGAQNVTIAMPVGFSAGSIAADPETRSLWIGDCGCPIE